jgi:hypothetical protein
VRWGEAAESRRYRGLGATRNQNQIGAQFLRCDLNDLLTPTNFENVIDAAQTSVYAIGYFRSHLGYATPPLSAKLILTA